MVIWNPFLSQEDLEFYRTVFTFAQEKIFPSVEERDEKEIWDPKIWEEIQKAGLAGLPVPVEYGGQGASCYQSCLAAEAMYAGSLDGGLGLSWAAHIIIGTMPIVLEGNEKQKQKYLPKLASGEWIAGFALTEPEAGSDAASLQTKAKPTQGGFILNGSKIYITNGPVGQVFIVMARTGEKSRGPVGISAFIVESKFPGFQVSKVLRKLGHHTSMTAELVFQDMFVPEENLLGPLHSGFLRIGKAILEWERTVLIAGVSGAMEYALNASLRYSKERKQFDKPIQNFYAIQEKMVKNWVYLNVCRILEYNVAKKKDKGLSLPMECSVIKLLSSELGDDVARETIQIFGGYGFMKEYHVERMYRDLKLGTIGGGTSEIQRSIIASTLREINDFKNKLESIHSNIPGWDDSNFYKNQWELLLQGLEELISYKKKSGKSHQVFDFAYADLISILLGLDQYRAIILKETSWYNIDAKIRDSYLCLDFLVEKYYPSLHKLCFFSNKIQEFLSLHNQLHQPYSEKVESTFKFLKEHYELQ